MEYPHHARTCKRLHSSSRSVRHVCTLHGQEMKDVEMHPGGAQLCSVCCQPPPEEFPTTSPVSPWDHQKGGSPGKLPTTTHARNETHGEGHEGVNHLDHHSQSPTTPSLACRSSNPTTMLSKMPCICASTHTFSLRCPNSIASVPNRPARCQAPAPSPVLTTWFTSRSASRNIPTQTNTLPNNIPFPVRCFPTPPKKISAALST